MEKKMTVPPSAAVDKMAPCSHPGTSTQTTVMSAGAPSAGVTASERATGSRASAMATSSASLHVAEQLGLMLNRNDANSFAGTARPGLGQRQ